MKRLLCNATMLMVFTCALNSFANPEVSDLIKQYEERGINILDMRSVPTPGLYNHTPLGFDPQPLNELFDNAWNKTALPVVRKMHADPFYKRDVESGQYVLLINFGRGPDEEYQIKVWHDHSHTTYVLRGISLNFDGHITGWDYDFENEALLLKGRLMTFHDRVIKEVPDHLGIRFETSHYTAYMSVRFNLSYNLPPDDAREISQNIRRTPYTAFITISSIEKDNVSVKGNRPTHVYDVKGDIQHLIHRRR